MPDNSIAPWQPNDVVEVPPTAASAPDIAAFARQLSEREQAQLVQAFNGGLYEIGTTFVWNRTMAGLKNRLASLGIEFVAEMLERPDIRPTAEIHEVLTDYDAVRLAQDLGMFDSTLALRLRHSLETISHFANGDADGDSSGMMPEEAIGALRTCVQAVLGHENIEPAVQFASFRRRLETTLLDDHDAEIDTLTSSAYFFRRIILRTLLAATKAAQGAQLETVLGNLNILLPKLWPGLKDPDRFVVGRAYAELHADGRAKAASGIRTALVKVAGFDYVPETLRSTAFLEAASLVQSAHFGWNNFYNEPAPMRALASLGTSIPGPAFKNVMTAAVLVRIGNRYGVSDGAQGYANQVLEGVTTDRWVFFFDQCLTIDDILLSELQDEKISRRWCNMVAELPRIARVVLNDATSEVMLAASRAGNSREVRQLAQARYRALTV